VVATTRSVLAEVAVEALRLLKAGNNRPVQLRLSLRVDLLNVSDAVKRVTSLETVL